MFLSWRKLLIEFNTFLFISRKLLIEFIYKRHIDLQSNTEDPETIKTLYCAATEWAVEELKLILADHMTQFFPHFSHTLKCRFNHGLKVTCDCTQREVGTIRDQFPYDKSKYLFEDIFVFFINMSSS